MAKVVKINSDVFGPVYIDEARIRDYRNRLAQAYRDRNNDAIKKASSFIRQYVAEGLDDYKAYDEKTDDYRGDDPAMLADQYITHVYNDSYLDDDADAVYIQTGLKPYMRNGWDRTPVQLSFTF